MLADAGRDLLWSMLSYEPEKRPNISEVADRALGLAGDGGYVIATSRAETLVGVIYSARGDLFRRQFI